MLGPNSFAALREFLSAPTTGDRVDDRYELLEEIGSGGSGTVWHALDHQTSEPVAVKLMRPSDEGELARVRREGRNAADFPHHPNLVQTLASGTWRDHAYLVMELLKGESLATRLARGPLSASDTLSIAEQLVDAVACIHELNITHRDIKPSNVFLVDGAIDSLRLLDFGLSRHTDDATVTRTGSVLGTPGYFAPEVVRGEAASSYADMFSLGCVLHECLTGCAAFSGTDTSELLAEVLLSRPQLGPEIPSVLADFVVSLLRTKPEQRPTAVQCKQVLPNLRASIVASVSQSEVLDNKYRLIRRLGQGGMGEVYLAEQLGLHRSVAIKFLRISASLEQEQRFMREAQTMARLDSPRLVRVFDVGRSSRGVLYFAMEHLTGQTLASYLANHKSVPSHEALHLAKQVCVAMQEVHAAGIIHRDIKPSNVFLVGPEERPTVKILDFGISKLTEESGAPDTISLTQPGHVVGSAPYMSPEQIEDRQVLDERTDIWSMGVVMYEILAGVLPFTGTHAATLGAQIVTAEPIPLTRHRPGIPPRLAMVVSKCLSKNPDKRFPNFRELHEALESIEKATSRKWSLALAGLVLASLAVAASGIQPLLTDKGPATHATRARGEAYNPMRAVSAEAVGNLDIAPVLSTKPQRRAPVATPPVLPASATSKKDINLLDPALRAP